MAKKTNKRKQSASTRRRANPGAIAHGLRARLEPAARAVAPGLLITAIAFGLPYTIYHGYLHAVSSPYFNVTAIDIQGAEFIAREAALTQAQLAPGVNIFDVREAEVARRLEAHPWIAQARVERKLPGTVTMTITEHRPAALLMDEGAFLLVDEQGEFFKVLDERDPAARLLGALPLIGGIPRPALENADASGAKLVREAILVAGLWEEMGLGQEAPLDHVHADPAMGLSLIVGDQGVEVRLGWGKWRERLERYRLVQRSLQERDVPVEYILLDQDESLDRVAVGPAQAGGR